MKPTDDEATPRRDGWFEHDGRWGEVTVGTVIANSQRRTERWEVIEQAMSTPVPFLSTLWMRVREMTTGQMFTVPPRNVTTKVIILTEDPADTTTPPRTPPSDVDAIMLVIEQLGATLLASRDETTGEIVCPDYIYDTHLPTEFSLDILPGLIEHLQIAHGVEADAGLSLVEAITLHGRAHDLSTGVTQGGFAHRHVPEDITVHTGK